MLVFLWRFATWFLWIAVVAIAAPVLLPGALVLGVVQVVRGHRRRAARRAHIAGLQARINRSPDALALQRALRNARAPRPHLAAVHPAYDQ